MDNNHGLSVIFAKLAIPMAGLVSAALVVEPLLRVACYIATLTYTSLMIRSWFKNRNGNK